MPSGTALFLFVGFAIVGGVVGAIASQGAGTNAGFADDAAALAFVGMLAVAIERILELTWDVLKNTKTFGEWWPLTQVRTAFNQYETQANDLLNKVFESTEKVLTEAASAKEATSQKITTLTGGLEELKRQKDRLKADFENAKTLAPGSSRLALVVNVVDETNKVLNGALELADQSSSQAKSALATAGQTAERAYDLVKAFKDNPARRIASIFLGAGLGMAAAGFMGLNMFVAVLKEEAGPVAGMVGVLLTGIVIGLGSNPTHEVIKALQRYKESKNPLDLIERPAEEKATTAAASDALKKLTTAADVIERKGTQVLKTLAVAEATFSAERARTETLGIAPLDAAAREGVDDAFAATIGPSVATLEQGGSKRTGNGNGSEAAALQSTINDLRQALEKDFQAPLEDARKELKEAGARAIRPRPAAARIDKIRSSA